VRGWAKLVSDRAPPGRHRRHRHRQGAGVQAGGSTRRAAALDDLAKPGTILLFESQAKKLEVKVGDALTFTAPTTRGASNTLDVAGGGNRQGPRSALKLEHLRLGGVPADALTRFAPTATGAIHMHLKPEALDQVPAIMERLAQAAAQPATGSWTPRVSRSS